MGKGWAKGLTAETDRRVARMAEVRRGRARGPYRLRRGARWEWTPDIAYAVGLIATDGNLSPSGRHVSVSSAEREVLETFLRCIGRSAHIGTNRSGFGSLTLRVQIGDVALYRWLQSIGLTPRKSHTLGAIDCPTDMFPHLLRGLLDGDGSIVSATYDGTGKARGRRYRVLKVRFISASEARLLLAPRPNRGRVRTFRHPLREAGFPADLQQARVRAASSPDLSRSQCALLSAKTTHLAALPARVSKGGRAR